MNFEIILAGQRFANPLVLASGTFSYGLRYTHVIDRVGAIVTKGITVSGRAGNPPPRIWDTAETVVNSVGLENVGLERFSQEILPSLRFSTPVYVNLAGVTTDDFAMMLDSLGKEERVSGFELNLSCPNVKEGGQSIGQSASSVAEVTSVCRKLTAKPLWVKLTSNFCDVRETAVSAAEAGADAVVLLNTLSALLIDAGQRHPFLGAGSGGLSGPAIKPYVLYVVREVSKVIDTPIIASGGVVSGLDVIQYLLAGASLVQVGSVNLQDPEACLRILAEIEKWLNERDLKTLADLIGKLED
ncbi:dihydroorotate dehydrogenase [candidate division WOR-3 bacterium]|nr:dihydroorotate dehydrogenase [candidate division WOR-3 bacterium]